MEAIKDSDSEEQEEEKEKKVIIDLLVIF